MGSDAIFFCNFSVYIQNHREGQFVLINIFFYNFFPFSCIDTNDNKSLIFELIV